MRLDFAPMEGPTTSLFRQLHHEYFPGVDRYYIPFVSPTKEHKFTAKDLREIAPEYNEGIQAVPQLLSKVADDVIWAVWKLQRMGYAEVNINLGCPSGTVTAKKKGSGMLSDLQALDQFLDGIFSGVSCAISVKTRLGVEDPEEFDAILEIYNRYPIHELIIHPRVRKDFYKHPIRTEEFEKALQKSKNPVCFNGGIVTASDFQACEQRFPQVNSIMIGQGLIADPFLAGKIRSGTSSDVKILREFHDRLFDGYSERFGDRNNAMRRMKELWFYLSHSFADCDSHRKDLLKARDVDSYRQIVSSIFSQLNLLDECPGGW